MYAVDEIGYEVKNASGTVIAHKDASTMSGEIEYTPEYNDDADDVTNYTITLSNTEKNQSVGKELDLTIHKNWPYDTDYAAAEDTFAKFRLMRTWHTEQKNLADDHIDRSKQHVTIQVVNNNGEVVAKLEDVPVGTPFRLQAGFKAKDAGNGAVVFRRSDNSQEYRVNHNRSENMSLGYGEVIYAPENGLTLTYQQGDNYLADGLHGVVISDRVYGAATMDQPDTRPSSEYPNGFNADPRNVFTLSKVNEWQATFHDLPQTVVDVSNDIETTTVYGYYFEEIDSNPRGFGAKYYVGDNEINENNKVFFTSTVEANNRPLTEFKVFKEWWNAEDKDMPGIVYELYRQARSSNGNEQGEPVLIGTFMLDQTGAYQLDPSTHLLSENVQLSTTPWTNTHYANTDQGSAKYFFLVKETGIYAAATEGDNAGKWTVTATSNQYIERITYKAEPGRSNDSNPKDNWNDARLDLWSNNSQNAKLTIRNQPKPYTNQLHIIKRWRDFTSGGGVSDIRNLKYEIEITMFRKVIQQDDNQVLELKAYGHPITLICDGNGNYTANTGNNAWGQFITDKNGEWHYMQHNTNAESLPLYGYYTDSAGVAHAVKYEYSFAELSAKTDVNNDGVWETNWLERVLLDGDANSTGKEGTVYLMDNFKTSKIILRKKWVGTLNADHVLFKIIDDHNEDWAQTIYTDYLSVGSRTYGFFGLEERNLVQYNGEWYFAVYSDQVDSEGNWSLTVDNLPYLFVSRNTDRCHEQEYTVTEKFIHDTNGYHPTSDSSVLYTSWYRGTKKADPQISTGSAHVQMGRDDENAQVDTTTTVITSNISTTTLEVGKKWLNKEGNELKPSDDNPVSIEIEGKTYKIDKVEYVLKVTVKNRDGSDQVIGYYTGSTGGQGELTLSDNISGAKKFALEAGENHSWHSVLTGLPSGTIFDLGSAVSSKRFYLETYEYELEEYKVYASGNNETDKDVTAYFLKAAAQKTGGENNSVATWTMKNTETDQILGAVKVAKVYSGIAALPTGFKIVAEWKDSNNTSKTKELTVSEATGSGTASSPYVWTITDLPINTEVTFTESGYTVDGYKISVKVNDVAVAENKEKTGNATAVADPDTEARGSLVFENNYVKSFEFTKVWRDAVGTNRFDWPEGKAITVVILQSTGDNSSAITNTYASYTITKNDLVENREISAKNTETDDLPKLKVISISDSKYGFRLEGLPAGERGEDSFVTYIYSVKEDPAVEGYQSPKYYMGDTVQHGDSVKDGGTIANDIISYELPQTGGIGTTLFTALGGLMTVAAGAVLTLKSWRRRKQNT